MDMHEVAYTLHESIVGGMHTTNSCSNRFDPWIQDSEEGRTGRNFWPQSLNLLHFIHFPYSLTPPNSPVPALEMCRVNLEGR